MSAANNISKDQIMTDKSIPSPASTTPASSNASVESVFVIDECEGVAHAVRAMGLNIGDTIEGREEGPRGIWHEARLTLLWVGQREAVWKEQTRSDEAWEWSEPEESADWSLDGRNWKIISRTEVSRLATGRGWLPIESAPLFTPLDDPIPPCLVYAPGYGVCMGAAGQDKFGHKYACINSVSGSAGDIVTHFMPLPAAPGATSQGVAVAQPDERIVKVSSQGVQFGNAWFSHEKITGYSAEQLNSGLCKVTGKAYMEWFSAAPPAPPAPLPGKDERAAFEAWASKIAGLNVQDVLETDGVFDSYGNDSTQDAWDGWQARAALSSPPALEAAPADAEQSKLCWGSHYPRDICACGDCRYAREAALSAQAAPADYPPTVSKEQALEGLNRAIKRLQMDIDDGSRPDQWSMQAIQENIRIGRRFIEQSGRSGVSADPLPNRVSLSLGPVAFQFTSHQQWVNKAQSWFANLAAENPNAARKRYLCIDAKGRVCMIGKDFGRARDEDAFPVKLYLIDAAQQHQVKKGELS